MNFDQHLFLGINISFVWKRLFPWKLEYIFGEIYCLRQVFLLGNEMATRNSYIKVQYVGEIRRTNFEVCLQQSSSKVTWSYTWKIYPPCCGMCRLAAVLRSTKIFLGHDMSICIMTWFLLLVNTFTSNSTWNFAWHVSVYRCIVLFCVYLRSSRSNTEHWLLWLTGILGESEIR